MSSSIKYRAEIDGLRAIAVISVIIYHLNANWLPGGFLGVDIFFVISGFLITGIIIDEIQENRFSFRDFYTRRIKRIYAAFIAVMLPHYLSIMILTNSERLLSLPLYFPPTFI